MAEEQVPAIEEQRITVEVVANAEKMIGMTFTEGEREFMLEEVNKKLGHYEKLRGFPLMNSVAPPLIFDPRLEHTPAVDAPRNYSMTPVSGLTRPANLEDLAFYPTTHLAELVRTRQVTSVELAQMYLERLKRYDPFLHCVVTLTEDLAMKQARRADEEIASGHYRGFARHPLGCKRPTGNSRLSHHLGRRTLSAPDD
jgi:hypothetical protein